MGGCASRTCPDELEDVVDPDMYGIGVIIAFAITAFLALSVALVAIVRGGIPDYYYQWLDEKLLSTLPAKLAKSPKETPDNLGYQTFLLTISDQILLTGVCYAIAMFFKKCDMSVLSFQVGYRLISISSTVHIATLAVLKAHFLEHRRQAIARCVLMAAFLLLLFAAAFLEAYTWFYDLKASWTCAYEEQLSGTTVTDLVAFVLNILTTYLVAILSIKPRKDKFEVKFWTTSSLKFISSRTSCRADVEGYLSRKRLKASLAEYSKVHTLKQNPGFLKVVYITISAFMWEIVNSILFELILATFWFATNIYSLCVVLFAKKVDTKEILSFGFGQIMPVLLLIVFAVTALEVGSIKHHRDAAAITSSRGGTTEASMIQEEAAVQHGHSAGRVSFTSDDGSRQTPSLRSESDSSTLDITSAAGPRTSTNSLSGLLETPSRNNTLEMEGGAHPSVYTPTRPANIIDVGMEHARVAAWFGIVVAVLLFAGTLVLIFFFSWPTFALSGLMFSLFVGELVVDVMRVHQRSVERQRSRDRVNEHPMVDLPVQNGSTQGYSGGTGVNPGGQSPVLRRSF